MNQIVESITLPAYWANALVNGDFSDLTPDEIDRCQTRIDALAADGWHVVDVERDADGCRQEPYFTKNYGLYDPESGLYDPESGFTWGGLLDYVLHEVK